MSVNIPTHFVEEYTSTVQLLLQRRGSKLERTVMIGNHVGDQAVPVDQIGAVGANEVATRFEAMPRVDAPTDRRWVFPRSFDLPQLIDTIDRLKIISDPDGSYALNGAYAMGRAKDNVIIDAFFEDSKTGRSGGDTTSFLAAQQIAVGVGAAAATGLNVKKLRAAKKLFLENEVDLDAEELWMVITAAQHDDLLGQAEVTSGDYNTRLVLGEDGMVRRFMGVNFIVHEGLPVNGSTQRRCPVYVRSGMHLGMWQDIAAAIDTRADLRSRPLQLYTYGTFGSTRLEEKKIAEVICAES